MKPFLLVVLSAICLSACTTTSAPATAWGKQGVSMLDYRTDGGQCAVLAATANPETYDGKTAGGIYGSNPTMPERAGQASQTSGQGPGASGGSVAPSGAAFPTGGSGAYRDSASQDVVQRAATEQRTREMAQQRARAYALKSCLSERGYTEFVLTGEQKQHLATLPQGSDERREYLYKLGTDPEVLTKQPAPKAGS